MSYRYVDYVNDQNNPRRINQFDQPSERSYTRYIHPTSTDFISPLTFQPSRERYRHIPPPPPPPLPPRHHHHHHHHYHNNNNNLNDVNHVDHRHSNRHRNSKGSSSNRQSNSSNNESHRQYRFENPSVDFNTRYDQDQHSKRNSESNNFNRSSNVDHNENARPLSNRSRVSHSANLNENNFDKNFLRNRREERQTTNQNQSSQLNSNVRSSNVILSSNNNSNSHGGRSIDNNSSSIRNSQLNRSMNSSMLADPESFPFEFVHPISLLTNILQSFLGLENSPRNRNSLHDDDQNLNALMTPNDFIGLRWFMQRPTNFIGPTRIHIRLGDLFDLFGDDETPSVGLSEEDIQRIPTINYKKSRKSNDDKCSICLTEYKTGETLKRLKCKHLFHPECIDPWLKTSVQCPICRATQQ